MEVKDPNQGSQSTRGVIGLEIAAWLAPCLVMRGMRLRPRNHDVLNEVPDLIEAPLHGIVAPF